MRSARCKGPRWPRGASATQNRPNVAIGTLVDDAATRPQCVAVMGKCFVSRLVLILIGSFLIGVTHGPGIPAAAAVEMPDGAPQAQRRFVETIDKFRAEYEAATTEKAKTALRAQRAAALCRLGRKIVGWAGALRSSVPDMGFVAVSIGGQGMLASAIDAHTGQLTGQRIKPGSEMDALLDQLSPGDAVRFSGQLTRIRGKDCFQSASDDLEETMSGPVFILEFNDLKDDR